MSLIEVKTPAEIGEAVTRLALAVNRDYSGRRPVVVGVLKGSFLFLADLVRLLDMPVEVDFIRAASYGKGRESSGLVRVIQDVETEIKDRDVILVDDIVDTGHTLKALAEHVSKKGPASLGVCVLLDKPSRRTVECAVDYVGMVVENKFLVGYGLDFAECYRNLGGLYELREEGGRDMAS